MMALLEHRPVPFALDVLAWSLPALLAVWLWLRSARGARATWLVVAFATFCFALDKAVDLHVLLRNTGQYVVAWLDPETHFRGKNVILRAALLGGIFVVGLIVLWWFVRADRQRTRSKFTALAGILVVMVYLGIRLMPGASAYLTESFAGRVIVGCAWLLVLAGEVGGLRAGRAVADGDADEPY